MIPMKLQLSDHGVASPHPMLAEALGHLARVIAIPSFSREEESVADAWQDWLEDVSYTHLRANE
ncbi:MAG: hypothetical protein K2G78_01915, partial [Muribaculaceae bacterium]|nr:hypothetical protein [Muribaculaceae bacterium]